MALKRLNYELIPEDHPAYAMMRDLISRYHEDLTQARIALAWHKDVKPDQDGHIMLGKCILVTDLQKELMEYDFIIVVNEQAWANPQFDDKKKLALLDHELCHATEKLDSEDEPVHDERGRHVYRVRKHDIEEFREVVQRHGTWKDDLQLFADALLSEAGNKTRTAADPASQIGGHLEYNRMPLPVEPGVRMETDLGTRSVLD